jgi:hypothetical protein
LLSGGYPYGRVKPSTRFYGALALSAVLLVACEGENTVEVGRSPSPSLPSEEPATGDACTLLTSEEVAEVVGAEVQNVEAATEGLGAQRCTWTIDPAVAEVVTLIVYTQNARTLHDAGKVTPEGEPAPEIEPVPGIGDDAYHHKPLATLNVRQGQQAFFVQFVLGTRLEESQTRSGLEELAKKALARL